MSTMREQELLQYAEAGFSLIPLYPFNYVDEKGVNKGKHPAIKNWLNVEKKTDDMLSHLRSGGNVGARLRAVDLVIDVDPRNFKDGVDSFAKMCDDLHIKPGDYPVVTTGSGGKHIYMRKPDGFPTVEGLPDYPGVEFKSYGRFMVTAGSIHPNGKPYQLELFTVKLSAAPQAPDNLLALINRAEKKVWEGGIVPGEFTNDELASMLSGLDPEAFRDHDKWLALMMSCHHATGGSGVHEFAEWCVLDPLYYNHYDSVCSRWASLSANKGAGAVTYKTLFKALSDADRKDLIPCRNSDKAFTAFSDAELASYVSEDGEEILSPLERYNRDYAVVLVGGKLRVFNFLSNDEKAPEAGYDRYISMSTKDFKEMLAGEKVILPAPEYKGSGRPPKEKSVPLSTLWMEWPQRRTYKQVVFLPGAPEFKGRLNLWNGWAVEPSSKGSWNMLRELLFESLCAGDEAVFEYVLNWSARMIQRPGEPGEVAVAFRGEKGIGKGTWGNALLKIAGSHGLHVTSPEAITGRFNGHLRDKVFLFSDEAVSPYDRESEGRLKGLITEKTLSYEAKGADIVSGKNCLHIMIASNNDAVVPAGLDAERRFLMQDAINAWSPDRSKFTALYEELSSGGYEALLFDLMRRDITKFDVRMIPQTKALAEQKLMRLEPLEAWWHGVLQRGGFEGVELDHDWNQAGISVFKALAFEDYKRFCSARGIKPFNNGRDINQIFNRRLKRLVPLLITDRMETVPKEMTYSVTPNSNNRAPVLVFPSLRECRREMDQVLGYSQNWSA